MVSEGTPEYRRARVQFDEVLDRFRTRAEQVREELVERAEALARRERERTVTTDVPDEQVTVEEGGFEEDYSYTDFLRWPPERE
ncbi:hypothetical protein [Haloechinothrix sp. LS1_15]|uniref:hypothetical protein n=1 Tax=Haloechinothrix sp. LS1_15 TaxID=2652248 RepID=UPI0029489666|nr:hypothetical protein [Haloechinothrix sp. LS1_15]MDV6013083.1 hypothetical protein [Haloechinothrix sp. LS1_15]